MWNFVISYHTKTHGIWLIATTHCLGWCGGWLGAQNFSYLINFLRGRTLSFHNLFLVHIKGMVCLHFKHIKYQKSHTFGINIMNKKLNFLKGGRHSNQGPRLTHKFNRRLLSFVILKAITWYLRVGFGKKLPCWKGNSRKIME